VLLPVNTHFHPPKYTTVDAPACNG